MIFGESSSDTRGNEPIFVERRQIFFTACVALLGAATGLLPGSPFPIGFCIATFSSALMHVALFLFFPRLKRSHFIAANCANILITAAVIHYTGGVTSPFVICLLTILISGAGYEILPRYTIPGIMCVYASVVGLEFTGLLPPVAFTAQGLYANPLLLTLVGLATLAFFFISGTIYETTVQRLREQVRRDSARAQETLLQMSRMEAHSQLGVTVSKIAHDIRGPLGAVRGFLETLEADGRLQGDDKEDGALMRSELGRVNALIDRMVRYVKPGAGVHEPLDLGLLLDDVLGVARFYPGAWLIRLEMELPASGACIVRGDKGQFQQAFFNLVKNAVEALRERKGGIIRVRLTPEEGTAAFRIADDGPGFPPQALVRLGKEQFTARAEGGGLGLLIVREIIEAHGGTVIFSNRPEGGAEVCVRLPSVVPGVAQRPGA
ncbi:MAG: HAMP domain-containing sensor histidine kinase [Elusimicrobiota bacterium]|jgi:signal transduction histidine kinase